MQTDRRTERGSELRRRLFELAAAVATYYGDDFVGCIEVNVFKGGVGSINVSQTFRPEKPEPTEGRVTTKTTTA